MDFLNSINSTVPLPNVISSFQNNTSLKQIMVLNLFINDNNVLKNGYLNAANKHNLSLIEFQ